MDEIQKKVGLWLPSGAEGRLARSARADRPMVAPHGGAESTAESASIRLLPEHFAQPELFESLRARRGQALVAEGDSWFDFPLPTRVDLLDALDELGRRTVSLAYRGDTLENMIYGTQGADGRPEGSDLDRLVTLIGEVEPAAVLFSGGGNDVAGDEFHAFLNHRLSNRTELREGFLREYVREYMRDAYRRAIEVVGAAAPDAKFIVHGYAHAKPTGVGIGRIFGWNLVGPWLKPALDATGYDFEVGKELVRKVIDEFNGMLADLAGGSNGRVVHVDFRPHVGESLDDWSDELHLNNGAVRRAARVLDEAIAAALGG